MSLTITVNPAPEINDAIRISASFKTLAGVPADPDAVTIRLRSPNSIVSVYTSVTTPAVVRDTTGEYHLDVQVTSTLEWFYRVEGTGAVQESGEGSLVVRISQVI